MPKYCAIRGAAGISASVGGSSPTGCEGATIPQVMAATGWQAHTVRGTFAGAFKKKLGLNLVSEKVQGGDRVYRVG